jgi:hypothetical protein
MNETKMNASGPRFTHISSPAHLLARPLPEELAAKMPAKVRREHEELVGRVEEAARDYGRLRAELGEAPKRDREAAAKAALAGEPMPEPSEPKLRAPLEQAHGVRRALDDALRTSADRLLAAAARHAEQVAGELEQRLGDGAADVLARLADLRQAVSGLGELYAAAGWVRSLAEAGEGATMSPYTAGNSRAMRNVLGELRIVEAAFTEDVTNAEERRRLARDEREEQRRLGEQWARERASAAERRAEVDAES